MDQQVEQLKSYLFPDRADVSEAEVALLVLLLQFAGDKIVSRRFPFDENSAVVEVPARYKTLQVRIAAELYAKMGAEGQVSHSENGISRAWESSDVSQSLLEDVVPMASSIGGGLTL